MILNSLLKSFQPLQCDRQTTTVTLDLSTPDTTPISTPVKKHEKFRPKLIPHFTPEGDLLYDHFQYHSNQFCLSE